MDFVWADERRVTITVHLDEGETLGSLAGPTVAFVPNDPLNTEFAAILAEGFVINVARKR